MGLILDGAATGAGGSIGYTMSTGGSIAEEVGREFVVFSRTFDSSKALESSTTSESSVTFKSSGIVDS